MLIPLHFRCMEWQLQINLIKANIGQFSRDGTSDRYAPGGLISRCALTLYTGLLSMHQPCTRAHRSMCSYLYAGLLSMHQPCTRARRLMCSYLYAGLLSMHQSCTRAHRSMCSYLYTSLLSMHQSCTRAYRLMCSYLYAGLLSMHQPCIYKGSSVDVLLLASISRPSKYAPALYKGSSVDVSLLLLSSLCKSCKWQTLGSGAWEQERD